MHLKILEMNKTETVKLKYAPYLGQWRNSYDKARAISGFSFYEEDGQLMLSCQGSSTGFFPGIGDQSQPKPTPTRQTSTM